MKPTDTMTADAYQRLLRQQAESEKKSKRPKGHPEHDLQVACVAWFRAQYPADAAMLNNSLFSSAREKWETPQEQMKAL